LEKVDFADNIVEEGNDLDATEFVSFKFEEGARSEELAALCWQQCGNVHKLVVVYALVLVIRLREVVFQQMPQLLEVFLFEHLCCLVLQKSGSGLLSHPEEEGLVTLRLFEEKFGDLLECRILRLFSLLFLL